MNSSLSSLLISTSVTVLSIILGVVSYLSLQNEEESRQLVLGTFSASPVTYIIRDARMSTECSGSLRISLSPANDQTSMEIKGWMLVTLLGRSEQLEFDATLIFNALGQLSASVFRTNIQNESVRVGTTGVNPMNLQLYRGMGNGIGSLQPLLEQKIPGPVEIRAHKGAYQLLAPQLPALQSFRAQRSPFLSLPVTFEQTESSTSCSQYTAKPFDLTSFVHMAHALSKNIRGALPGL